MILLINRCTDLKSVFTQIKFHGRYTTPPAIQSLYQCLKFCCTVEILSDI